MTAALILLALAWPGDVNGDGRADLLDYGAVQILHGRETREECLYRMDNKTLALRPATAHLFDYTGRTLTEIKVVDGCFERPIGFGAIVVGEDMECHLHTMRWLCKYEWWVDAQSNAAGAKSATMRGAER